MSDIIDQDHDGVDDVVEMQMEMQKDTWKNRRAMAWISFLICVVFYPLLILISHVVAGTTVEGIEIPDLTQTILEVKVPIYTLCTTIIVGYFSLVTWQDISSSRGK